MPGSSLLLYSTNPWMKWHIQHEYRGDRHWAWCSEQVDSRKVDRDSLAALTPSTSNPAEIYADLRAATNGARADRHNAKIKEIRASYLSMTTEWVADGSMTNEQRDEVVYLLESGELSLWRPLLYVVPRNLIDPARLHKVHPSQRASPAMEYIIKDLAGDEFERVELP